jgi:hypothetical protein
MPFPKLALPFCVVALLAIALAFHPTVAVKASPASTPSYAANGDMLPPTHYREWIYLTSGIDMSYSAKAMSMGEGMSMFDNVFVNPEAYRSFLSTGIWPDKTVMIIEGRHARTQASRNPREELHFVPTESQLLQLPCRARRRRHYFRAVLPHAFAYRAK